MTIVVVQCRLSSSRLPEKAFLPLGAEKKPLFIWTLRAMKKVQADQYWLACDYASYERLNPLVQKEGWNCFAGPENDVLERFCLLVQKVKADIIVRATADNPFLFFEAAQASLDEFKKRACDYFTYSGLPHGSGVEILSAAALLKARKENPSAFEKEHVGPALYNHTDRFVCINENSDERWNYPLLRTTVDTLADYHKACRLCRFLESSETLAQQNLQKGYAAAAPYSAERIIWALQHPYMHPVLTVPAVRSGCGTGHVKRCLSLALSDALYADVYVPAELLSADDASSSFACGVTLPSCGEAALKTAALSGAAAEMIKKAVTQNGLPQNRIVHTLPKKGEYALIVTDGFCTDAALGSALHECAPVIAIDEGSRRSDWADFLIDIIPPLKNKTVLNKYAPYFIPLSVTRNKLEPALKKTVSRILICLGGEDPSNLALPAARCFARVLRGTHVHITVVTSAAETARAAAKEPNISYVPFIPGLPERIGEYDLVVTHYGFTAFEAASAGCLLLLLATSTLHKKLAQKYGCVCIEKKQLSEKKIHSLLSKPECLQPKTLCSLLNTAEAAGTVSVACTPGTGEARDLAPFIASLTGGKRRNCPLCSNLNGLRAELNPVVARDEVKTVRRCRSCGMLYISWLCVPKKEYSKAYFFEEYKKQYGKTYLEDFASIKAQGLRRMALINRLCRTKAVRQPAQKSAQKSLQKPAQNEAAVLDIGCAYGAFLSAAADFLWQPFGLDICSDAVDYVVNTLGFFAVCAAFPAEKAYFNGTKKTFDALTMWFVIEHFEDLHAVLLKVSESVKTGGVFAFSTPSASGLSARFAKKSFLKNSPSDHFIIWDIKHCRAVLKKYGFKVCKIVSIGHHPERFPYLKLKQTNRIALAISKLFALGDSFEVYCKKIR